MDVNGLVADDGWFEIDEASLGTLCRTKDGDLAQGIGALAGPDQICAAYDVRCY